MPIQLFTERSADEWADECAKIYSHVKHTETSIPSRAALRIKFPDHRADIRLEHSRSDYHQDQAHEERFRSWNRQHKMTGGNDHPSVPHCSLRAEKSIGQPAAG